MRDALTVVLGHRKKVSTTTDAVFFLGLAEMLV